MRVAVVGGGIIGVAVARTLAQDYGATVTLYEKEDVLGHHQTGHNSGVVHAGLYYEPGSLKARLCRQGSIMMAEFAEDRGIPFERCGKVVVGTTAAELPALEAIFAKAVANGVPGVRLVDRARLADIEPSARGVAAIHSPNSAITDYVRVTLALADDVRAAGGDIRLATAVTAITAVQSEVLVTSNDSVESQAFDLAITCAGLQSDRLADRSGDGGDPRIVPFTGSYFLLRPEKRELVNGLIYPVPNPQYPFLGIHLTRRIDGEVMVGPNAFLAGGRESYRCGGFVGRDVASALTYPGMWRFAAANLSAGFRELRAALDKNAFIREAQKYVPEITGADVIPGFRGVRAQAMFRNGALADDFVISGRGRIVAVRNAPSPGATSSLAIAEYLAERAVARLV